MPVNKRDELIAMGFKELPHPTIGMSLIYDLGRGRYLSFSSIDTPNEMLFLGLRDGVDEKKVTDLICLRNWDYNGFTYIDNIKKLIEAINN